MRGRDTIRASGSLRGLLISSLVLLAGIASLAENHALAQDAAASCAPVVGRVVALQGNVELQRAGTTNWLKVSRLDTSICGGDRLRTDALSRAALFVQPETLVRVDQNTTISVNQTTAEVLVEFHVDEIAKAAQNAQSCGAGYFITRFPRKFKVSTPHMNAAVEGTEFMVESSCKASTLTVLEGQVLSQSSTTQETRSLTAGQRIESGAGSGSVFSTVVRPADAVQWVLRYPPLSDATTEAEIPTADQCRALPESTRSSCLTERAEVLLRLGRVDQALQDIDEALSVDSGGSNVNALRAIIQIAKNDKAAALESAEKATASGPSNSRAWLALSYAQQASFELELALESSWRAQALEADSALIHARVAELLLSLGQVRAAEKSARAAVSANPAESSAHTILGFVHLAKLDTTAARAAFDSAIERDSFSGMPRLGLGIALIREGQLGVGREQLEIAVALDPANSLFRSYAGKAYYEENTPERDDLASAQFDLAEKLDPLDPTYSLYSAILRQSENRPVEALQQLQSAIAKNDNRAVYRSRLLLDDDAAAQDAGVAAIYGNLGFEKLAILESAKALSDNPGNHSAHRQLASAYANLPRHDIARVSEALQAQIRQPLSASPVSPLLATDGLLVLRDTGPSQLGAYEYNQLFNREDLELTVDGLIGSRDTLAGQIAMSGLQGKNSYALTVLNHETDGFTANDAVEKTVYDGFFQRQLAVATSIQANIKRFEFDIGQTFFPFESFAEQTTISETSDTIRVSGHHVIAPGNDWIGSAVYEDRDRGISTFPDDLQFTSSAATAYSVELQNLYRFGQTQIVSGVGYVEDDSQFDSGSSDTVITAANVYAYGQWQPENHDLSVHIGLAADWFELDNSQFTNRIRKDHFSPKLGVVWSPRVGTTLRAAAFSSLRRPLIRSQTVEPTQVAGFNQFFTGFEQFFGDRDGTTAERIGLAVDQKLSNSETIGFEVTKRRLEVPSIILDRDFDWEEKLGHLYVYKSFVLGEKVGQLSGWQGSVSAEVEYERIERPQILTGAEGIMDLETIRAPIGFRLFNENGITVRATGTFVRQEGEFSADVGFDVFQKKDDAWIVDLSVEYRLPKRAGSISIGANNLFDTFVDVLETDPLYPRTATRRVGYVKFRLNF